MSDENLLVQAVTSGLAQVTTAARVGEEYTTLYSAAERHDGLEWCVLLCTGGSGALLVIDLSERPGGESLLEVWARPADAQGKDRTLLSYITLANQGKSAEEVPAIIATAVELMKRRFNEPEVDELHHSQRLDVLEPKLEAATFTDSDWVAWSDLLANESMVAARDTHLLFPLLTIRFEKLQEVGFSPEASLHIEYDTTTSRATIYLYAEPIADLTRDPRVTFIAEAPDGEQLRAPLNAQGLVAFPDFGLHFESVPAITYYLEKP